MGKLNSKVLKGKTPKKTPKKSVKKDDS